MSPLVAYHSTVRRHRKSIHLRGLLLNKPAQGRPFGVYVFVPGYGHPTFSRGHRVVWGSAPPCDLWQVSYIGPIVRDWYVQNGLIFGCAIPPEHLSLITHITPES